jgi:hypothetical protein
VQVRLHVDPADLDPGAWRDRVGAYAAVGVTDLALAPQTRDRDAHRRWLEAVLPVLSDGRSADPPADP